MQDAVRAVQQAFPDKPATGYKFKRTLKGERPLEVIEAVGCDIISFYTSHFMAAHVCTAWLYD